MSNFKFVQAHNKRYDAGQETYTVEMNGFADLPSEEFAAKYLMKNFGGESNGDQPKDTKKCTGRQAPDTNLPETIDWSTKGTN